MLYGTKKNKCKKEVYSMDEIDNLLSYKQDAQGTMQINYNESDLAKGTHVLEDGWCDYAGNIEAFIEFDTTDSEHGYYVKFGSNVNMIDISGCLQFQAQTDGEQDYIVYINKESYDEEDSYIETILSKSFKQSNIFGEIVSIDFVPKIVNISENDIIFVKVISNTGVTCTLLDNSFLRIQTLDQYPLEEE